MKPLCKVAEANVSTRKKRSRRKSAVADSSQGNAETRRKAALHAWSELCEQLDDLRTNIERAAIAGHLDNVTHDTVLNTLDQAMNELVDGRPRRRAFED